MLWDGLLARPSYRLEPQVFLCSSWAPSPRGATSSFTRGGDLYTPRLVWQVCNEILLFINKDIYFWNFSKWTYIFKTSRCKFDLSKTQCNSLSPKTSREICLFDTRKNKVCSFDSETLDLTYMSPCQNFVSYLTLPWLLLAFTVRCVDQAAGKDQNTLMWT